MDASNNRDNSNSRTMLHFRGWTRPGGWPRRRYGPRDIQLLLRHCSQKWRVYRLETLCPPEWNSKNNYKILYPLYFRYRTLCSSVPDPNTNTDPPNPHVYWTPGSGSGSNWQRYGSGSFYHQAKYVKKNDASYCFQTFYWLLIYIWIIIYMYVHQVIS